MEHICLLKAKVDLSEEEENDMLDFLYTTQYQMGGILAVSLGELLLHIDMKLSLLYQIKSIVEWNGVGLSGVESSQVESK